MSLPDTDDVPYDPPTNGEELKQDVRQTMLTGTAITIPFFITLIVLVWALDFVSNLLAPIVDVVTAFQPLARIDTLLIEAASIAVLLGIIFVVGLVSQRGPNQPKVGQRLDAVMGEIPGIGSVYTSVNRLSEVILESDTESFQDVKLVEFPMHDTYVIGFLTADTPTPIEDAASHGEMKTIFLPMAPNPVMGGHLVHLPEDRVYDVDMEVEEGMQAVMTTGAAVDQEVRESSDE